MALRPQALVAALLVALAACAVPPAPVQRGSALAAPAVRHRAAAGPSVRRVAVLVMENREYGQVIGNPAAPFVNRLAGRSALATRSFAASHPSLPNYLALLGGSTFGISSDCTSCYVHAANLVDQLERHGISWRAYMQGLPSVCDPIALSGRYAKKHDPFLYFDSIRNVPSRCANVVSFRRLHIDVSNGTLPSFVWITPDLCNDGHDCTTSVA